MRRFVAMQRCICTILPLSCEPVKTKDGTLIPGANIENASFGLTNCAERSAIFAAYSMGYRRVIS